MCRVRSDFRDGQSQCDQFHRLSAGGAIWAIGGEANRAVIELRRVRFLLPIHQRSDDLFRREEIVELRLGEAN